MQVPNASEKARAILKYPENMLSVEAYRVAGSNGRKDDSIPNLFGPCC